MRGARRALPRLVGLDGAVGGGGLLRDVRLVVLSQVRLLPEALATQRARERFLTSMRPHMHVH